MKKLSPTKFKAWYTGLILGFLLGFAIFLISGFIFMSLNPERLALGIILLGIGFICLVLSWIIIAYGRKRMIGINQEIMDERFEKQCQTEDSLSVVWYLKQDTTLIQQGDKVIMTKEKLVVDTHSFIWKDILDIKTKNDENGWHMVLSFQDHFELFLPLFDLIIRLAEHYSGQKLDDQSMQVDYQEHQTFHQSIKVWGINKTLILQKFLFVFLSLSLGVGIALVIGLSFDNQDNGLSIGVIIANLIAIPLILIGFPKYFRDSQKFHYFLNKNAIGYAKGKKYMMVPFDIIESISYDDEKLYLNLTHLDDYGHPIILYIPMDRYLHERLNEHLAEYDIDKDVIRL